MQQLIATSYLKALSDSDPSVRLWTTLRLATLFPADRTVDEALLRAIGDPDREVSVGACQVLIHRDPMRDVAPLLAAIRRVRGLHAEADDPPTVDEILDYRLTKLKSIDVAGILLSVAADDDPDLRAAVMGGIAETRDPRALEALRHGLDDATASVRARAALGLMFFGDSARADLVRLLAEDSEPSVRKAAAAALGTIGGPGSREALSAASGDEAAEVREAVERALRELSGRE